MVGQILKRTDEEIESEMGFLQRSGHRLEWKVHGHDRPADLGERLRRRGFRPDPPETLLVREIDEELQNIPVNREVLVTTPATEADLVAFFSATSAAFGQPFSDNPSDLLARISGGSLSVHVACLDGVPVGAGRLEMPALRAFAGLYTGGIAPAHRGAGLYRALVRSRAREAAARGYQYLFSEATEASRPILERLAFKRLTTVQGWRFEPSTA